MHGPDAGHGVLDHNILTCIPFSYLFLLTLNVFCHKYMQLGNKYVIVRVYLTVSSQLIGIRAQSQREPVAS